MSRTSLDFRALGLDLAIGVGLAVATCGMGALLLWPFGQATVAVYLAKGFCVFLAAVLVALLASLLVSTVLRLESDPPRDPFILVNVVSSGFVQAGWAAFTALTVRSVTPAVSMFGAAVLLLIGLLASWVGSATTGAFFKGSVYKASNALISLGGYLLFAAWPAAGRALYGWFFGLW